MVLDLNAKAAAVNRIIMRASTAEKEAVRLGCNVRTIERAVAKEKKARGLVDVAPAGPSTGSPPGPLPGDRPAPSTPGNAAPLEPGGEIAAIDKVKAAAEGAEQPAAPSPKPPPAAPPPVDPVEDGKRRDGDFVVKTINQWKGVAVGLGGWALAGIPIHDQVLEDESKLSEFAEQLVREDAEEVAAFLREKAGGAGPLFALAIILIDVASSSKNILKRRAELYPKKQIEGAAEVKG